MSSANDPANAPPNATQRAALTPDVLIIGGGIAGLWLHNCLNTAGYDTLLVEQESLGAGQTIASQGMIHGGLKYSLRGILTGATTAIAGMPARWQQHFAGTRVPDLSAVPPTSQHYYMMTRRSLTSRLSGVLGARALRGAITALTRDQYPPALRTTDFSGDVYELADPVVDAGTLLTALAAPYRDRILLGRPEITQQFAASPATIVQIHAPPTHAQTSLTIAPQLLLLCAGTGNAALLAAGGSRSPAMQRRPLHQITVAPQPGAPDLPELFCHCVDSPSSEPAITITSHVRGDGRRVWYLGGAISSGGVGRAVAEQHEHTRVALARYFPWLDWRPAAVAISSFHIDRAEAATPDRARPDGASVTIDDDVITCWPTKLTLAPDLGDAVLAHVRTRLSVRASGTDRSGQSPSLRVEDWALVANWPKPPVANAPWADTADVLANALGDGP